MYCDTRTDRRSQPHADAHIQKRLYIYIYIYK